jgi:hypothetical protein
MGTEVKLIKLEPTTLQAVLGMPESGMDFTIVSGECDIIPGKNVFVVRGNGCAILLERYEGLYSLVDMYDGQPLPSEHRQIALDNIVPAASLAIITLPVGYLPARGAHQLLGSVVLSHNTRFVRFTSSPTDSRFSSNSIVKDTYLTSLNDRQFVNSGFGAVGRYSLPMPMPASYVHEYTIPKDTALLVGTVAPQFGQSGGGVEVKTTSTVTGVSQIPTSQIDDY